MRGLKNTRKFGGKTFRIKGQFLSKRAAEVMKSEQRSHPGRQVRITTRKFPGEKRKLYEVWVRR